MRVIRRLCAALRASPGLRFCAALRASPGGGASLRSAPRMGFDGSVLEEVSRVLCGSAIRIFPEKKPGAVTRN